MNFKETLGIHLKAMKEKEIDLFISTICDEEVTLIMPNGTLITGREEFIDFHKDWFSDKDWDLNYEIMKLEESQDISLALIKVDYHDLDQNGNPYSMNYYLTLIFKYKEGSWGLVYDQNTCYKNAK